MGVRGARRGCYHGDVVCVCARVCVPMAWRMSQLASDGWVINIGVKGQSIYLYQVMEGLMLEGKEACLYSINLLIQMSIKPETKLNSSVCRF